MTRYRLMWWLALCSRSSPAPLQRLVCTTKRSYSQNEKDGDKFPITRIYSDDKGESKFGVFYIPMQSRGSIGLLSQLVPCDGGVMFRQTPADYNYSWHNAPQRQFIVNLDADVKVTVSTGETRTIKQGEVFFVEDTHGKGHHSMSVNGTVRHSIFIPVPNDYKPS